MSETLIRDSTTDNYQILSSYTNSQSDAERSIVQSLVQSTLNIDQTVTEGGTVYTSPANDSSWNYTDLSDNYINTSAIFNYPAGTITENSVIYVDLSQNDVSFNSYSTNISSVSCSNNTYSFSSLPTSAPFYDCNYVITQSINTQCYDDVSAVSFLFDNNNANLKIQYAMQSRWNTTTGPYADLSTVGGDPLAITQDVLFNTTQAFGQQGTAVSDPLGVAYNAYWSYLDVSNGSINFTSIDPSNQPIENNLRVEDRIMNDVSLNLMTDIGIYRIQQATPIIRTYLDGSLVTNATNLTYVPMFNGNGTDPLIPSTAKTDSSVNLIPGEMTYTQFESLFNTDVFNTINDEWRFSIDISSNNGGYTIQTPHPVMSNLDDSNIKDNLYYMENYVSNNHYIDIISGDISIDPSTNGIINIASSILVDLSYGEVLDASGAGVDGQIILNTNTINTRVVDVSSVDVTNTAQFVFYPTDSSGIPIDIAEQTNPYFEVMWQKVAQNTEYAPPEDFLVRNNNALLTLYTDRVVDGSYNTGDFDLSFNSTLAGTNSIKLWRIELGNNIIVNPESLYTDPSYSNYVQGISTLGILTNITEGLNYNNYRMLLTAKELNDIELYYSVTDVSGWSIGYTDASDVFLQSSSDNAFNVSENLPNYSPAVIDLINNAGIDLSFNYTYSTVEDANRPGGLVDFVEVSYTPLDGVSASTSFKILQSEITRNYHGTTYTTSLVSDSSYSFVGPIFNKQHWELVHVISDSSYNASFPARYGPFNNITLEVSNIQQQNAYYAVRNKSTGGFAPQSALAFVTTSIPNITVVNETIEPAIGNTLSINGIFTSADLKPFTSVIEATYDNVIWDPISIPTINTDTYYGLNNNANIIDQVGGIIDVQIEYTPFTSTTNDVLSLNLEYYYIPFTIDASNASYTLTSFDSTPFDLSSNTTIGATNFAGNTSYMSVQNNYSVTNTSSWSSSSYTSSIAKNGLDIVLTVKDLLGNTIFEITSNDTTVFLGTIIISYIPYDTYRADRLLGSVLSPTFEESFDFTAYNDDGLSGYFSLENIPGVYITNLTNDYSPSNSPLLGSYESFRVLGDFMNIAYYGTTTPPTSTSELGILSYNNSSLVFQYLSGPEYSAIFTFPLYRGYDGTGDQYYTIDRTPTSADFIVGASGIYTQLTDNLTSNMYYNESFTVDNLRDGSNNLCADLNVTGTFNYSILPHALDVSYNVLVTGDTLTVSIINSKYYGDASNIVVPTDSTPVIDPKLYIDSMTLKDYGRDNMYTFSGNWYLNNSLMGIRPSRVKLTNSNYTDTELNYYIEFIRPYAAIYKSVNYLSDISYNWLGNPSIHGSQDPDTNPSSSDWILLKTISQLEFYSGFEIGSKRIYQSPNLPETLRIAYFVSVPPYYKYEQISTENCPIIPYNYGIDYSANETVRYYPYTSLTNTFNPFDSSFSFTDISGNVSTVVNDQQYLNNVTFTLQTPATLTELYLNPDNQRVSAIVPGTNLEIDLYLGSYPSVLSGNHINPIYNGPITSIPSDPSLNTTNILFRNRDVSGGIYFSLLQFPVDIGYPAGPTGYQQVLHTNDQSEWYNIDMYVGNTSWFNDNSGVTFFDFDATGIFPTLYTVVDMNDPITQTNYRRVYKYLSPSPIDVDISNTLLSGLETFTMTFDARQYCDISISGGTFGTSGIWNYPSILENTDIGNTPITWITDASFSGSFAYAGWSFGNSTTAVNMLVELLGVQDTQQKWTYITLDSFMKYRNQFGLTVGSVAWDGSISVPLVKTRVIQLYPGITNPILFNNTTTIEQYSESTLN